MISDPTAQIEFWRFETSADRDSLNYPAPHGKAVFSVESRSVQIFAPFFEGKSLVIQFSKATTAFSGEINPLPDEIQSTLEKIALEPENPAVASHRIHGCVHLLLAALREKDPALCSDSELDSFIALVKSNLHQSIEIAELARNMGISPAKLRSECSAVFGKKPAQLIREIRLERGKELLAAGEEIEAVAEQTGYSDRFAFSRAFKAETGISPGNYRKNSAPLNEANKLT